MTGWPEQKAYVILSDIAPKTTGMKDVDEANSLGLANLAFKVAKEHLAPGGTFETFKKQLQQHFETVKIYRPDSTRLLATNESMSNNLVDIKLGK